MNLRRSGRKPPGAGPSNSLAQGEGPGTQHGYSSGNSAANGTNSGIDQLSHGLASTSLAYNQDGGWEVFTKKTKNRGNAQQGAPQKFTLRFTPRGAWRTEVADSRRANGGAANSQPYKRSLVNNAPLTAVAPPLQHRWQWGDRAGARVTPGQGSGGPDDSVLDAGDQQHQSDVQDEGDYYDDLMLEDDDEDAGLRAIVLDINIVWPPMVVVRNTRFEMDENDEKRIGMGNEEFVDYFSACTKAVKARHSYEPNGQMGMSILIFESSPVGYWEAENLHKYFTEQSTGRYDWVHHEWLFENGLHQLYGYMACKEDVDNFNKHCQGKKKLKFEVKSYQEMVVVPMRQMSEDNQQLVWLKNKVVGEQRHSEALEESLSIMAQKLQRTEEENRIVRQRTKVQHEQNKEEMDSQEQFFKDQIRILNQTLEENEKAFGEKLQEERTKVKLSTVDLTMAEDDKLRKFEAKREKLIKKYLKLENKIKDDLTKIMEYAPTSSEEVGTTDPWG